MAQETGSMRQRGLAWVAVQAALLLLLLLVPPDSFPWTGAGSWYLAGWLAGIAGVLLLGWSALNLGRALTPLPFPAAGATLATHGAYRFVRHPMYLGVLLVCLGLSLATASTARLLVTLLLFIFFDLKARREERWLVERYPAYRAYQRRVRRLIPWIY